MRQRRRAEPSHELLVALHAASMCLLERVVLGTPEDAREAMREAACLLACYAGMLQRRNGDEGSSRSGSAGPVLKFYSRSTSGREQPLSNHAFGQMLLEEEKGGAGAPLASGWRERADWRDRVAAHDTLGYPVIYIERLLGRGVK